MTLQVLNIVVADDPGEVCEIAGKSGRDGVLETVSPSNETVQSFF